MLLNKLFDIESEINILNIMEDSRKALPNSLYFCIKGITNDGHDFIDQAIQNGAKVIVHSLDLTNKYTDVFYIQVDDVLSEQQRVTQIFFDFPSKKLNMIGVTGTNGKTTIATVLYHLLNSENYVCGYMGTNGIFLPHEKIEGKLTTVSNVELTHQLQKMVIQDAKYAAIEVSSHGLIQKRVVNVDFDAAIYTNISHDHLDFHKTFEEYAKAKSLLFSMLKPDALAIINLDDQYCNIMIDSTSAKVVTYGVENTFADYRASNIKHSLEGIVFDLHIKGTFFKTIKTNLIAGFNVYNLLACIALLDQWHILDDIIIQNMERIPVVEGRFEKFQVGDVTYIVDFAHTPDGQEQLYKYVRTMLPDYRIITVFGSPGKRDIEKRYMFGVLADQYADEIILTADDPCDEDPADIAQQIASAIKHHTPHIIPDRKEAILYAHTIAKKGDVVLLLAKGRDRFNKSDLGSDYEGDDIIVQSLMEIQD